MLKLIVAVRRHPSFSRQQFFEYHRNEHAAAFFAAPDFRRHFRKYAQNHVISGEGGQVGQHIYQLAADRDVVVPLWFDSLSCLNDAYNEPQYQEIIQPDERVFVDFEDPEIAFLLTQEVTIQRPARTGQLKLFEFINPPPGIDSQAFVGSWMKYACHLEAIGACADATSGYACNITVPTGKHPRWPEPRFGGVVEMWFESIEQMQSLFRIRKRPAIRAMEASFIDPVSSRSIYAREYVIYESAPGIA